MPSHYCIGNPCRICFPNGTVVTPPPADPFIIGPGSPVPEREQCDRCGFAASVLHRLQSATNRVTLCDRCWDLAMKHLAKQGEWPC